MIKPQCCVCQKPKATLVCGLCENPVCKYCAQYTDEKQFSFLPSIPEELNHTTYCGPCYDLKIEPEIVKYEATMTEARNNISVFYTTDSKETRVFKRKDKPVSVDNCIDREEVLLRLAFLAAHEKYNAIIDVDVVAKKIRSGTYQTTKYSGSAILFTVTSNRFK